MGGRSFHLKIDVEGILSGWERFAKEEKLVDISKDDGTLMTSKEAKAYLERELVRGHLFLPIGNKCDNFDYKKGCLGHPVEPITARKMIEKYLKDNGFDGLFGDECGCQLNDLCPCDCSCSLLSCEPGYKHDAKEDDQYDFYIMSEKQS